MNRKIILFFLILAICLPALAEDKTDASMAVEFSNNGEALLYLQEHDTRIMHGLTKSNGYFVYFDGKINNVSLTDWQIKKVFLTADKKVKAITFQGAKQIGARSS